MANLYITGKKTYGGFDVLYAGTDVTQAQKALKRKQSRINKYGGEYDNLFDHQIFTINLDTLYGTSPQSSADRLKTLLAGFGRVLNRTYPPCLQYSYQSPFAIKTSVNKKGVTLSLDLSSKVKKNKDERMEVIRVQAMDILCNAAKPLLTEYLKNNDITTSFELKIMGKTQGELK